MLLTTIVNLTLMAFLTAWFVWWRKAMGQLARFKESRAEMAGLVEQLQTQLERAQAEIARLAVMAQAAVPEMQGTIGKAEALLIELEGMVGSGERVADRLEDAAKRARQAATAPGLHEERQGWQGPVDPNQLRARAEGAALALVRGGVEAGAAAPARKVLRGRPNAAAAKGAAAGATAAS